MGRSVKIDGRRFKEPCHATFEFALSPLGGHNAYRVYNFGVNFSMTMQPQQEFLRDAMQRLGMSRQEFADRIGATKRVLDNWLLPSNSSGFRPMSDTVWALVREILPEKKIKS